jgi:hypothetical protein
MSELNVSSAPQGKGMAVTGFVLSLVGLIFSSWIAAIAVLSIATGGSAWLMYFWLVLCIASVVLSVMGMSKLGKTGGKKGLGIAGMVIGIVATIYSIILVLGLSVAASAADSVGSDALQDAMEDMQNR